MMLIEELKNYNALHERDQARVLKAMDTLCTEPGIAGKLEKLAELKTKKPLMWKVALHKLTQNV